MNKNIKVLLVEDIALMRYGLQMVLEKTENITIAGAAENGKKGVELAKELSPDVILMDIGMPEMDGIEATRKIKEAGVPSKILIFTSKESEDEVFESLKAGADGYIMKGATDEQLITAIKVVADGTAWLDPKIAKLVLANVQKQKTVEKTTVPNPLKYKEYNLTNREYEVLKLIADGYDNNEIAEKLVITEATAKAHVHNLLGKLYVEDKHKATVLAYKEGLV